MPGSMTSVFGELDEFQAALGNEGYLNFFLTDPGQFRAKLTQVKLHRLRLSAVEKHVSRIGFLAVPAKTVLVSFPLGNQSAPIWGGMKP